jgi:hypothetical protein
MTHFKTAAALALIGGTVSCAAPPPSAQSQRYEGSMTNRARDRQAPMDPQRKVVEQDCSKPVELYRGNLLCK